MSTWMEPKSRVVVLTPLQIRQHRQSLKTAEDRLEEVRARAGKSPGPTTRKTIRDLEKHIEHTKALLGEKKYVVHSSGVDEFLGPDPKKQKPVTAGKETTESEPMEMLEKVKIVAKAIETEMLPNLEKHLEPSAELPAPKVEKAVAPGIQLTLDLNLPESPKSIFKGSLKDRLKSLNGGKKAI